ncbi:MAG TPA: tRNA-dihydrouridine synthase family protein [Candidatus Kapabacteria bacterium]|nr:tRNA-dihydrouridine synthase family protein [Candidatus Kapabacteria bacterium]
MLKIGNLEIKYNAMPSPMAAFTDIAYRKLMDEIGYTGFIVTEMISAEGLRRKQTKTMDMIKLFDFKTPQFIQLFGSEPDAIVEAAKYIENETAYSGIDINMGCPVPKVVRRGSGSALLKEPTRAAAIVRALKKNISLPVTVKIRLGFNEVNVIEVARMLDQEGADAIAVHFRLKSDGYKGQARWEYAPLIKDRVKTLLIGNGDILTAVEAKEKLNTVDGVMIGRGAVRNPLIFKETAGVPVGDLNLEWGINRLLELIQEYYPPRLQLSRAKAFARFLFAGRIGCKKIRTHVHASTTFEEAKRHLMEMNLKDII